MSTAEPRDPEPTAPAADAPPVDEPLPADESLPADPDAYDSPRGVRARARGLAAPYIAGGEDPDMAGARREERRNLRILFAMVVVIVLSGFVLGALQKLLEGALVGASDAPATAVASAPARTSEPTSSPATGDPTATVAPGASPVPGAFEGGVPTTLDGIDVMLGTALLTASSSRSDAAGFLVGGWFHAEQRLFYCPIQMRPPPLWTCPGIALYVGPATKVGVILAPGNQGQAGITFAEDAYRPVVLQVHTHDGRCPAEDAACPELLVLDGVAWVGASVADAPLAPREDPPVTSFGRQDAIAKAWRFIPSAFDLSSATVARESEAAHHAGPVVEDPWVWWLRFHVPGTGRTGDVVLDSLTGRHIKHGYASS